MSALDEKIPAEVLAVVKLRQRKMVDDLDYRRAIAEVARGYSQREFSKWLGISQPALSSALKNAQQVAPPRDGFSGATPAELCQRYAAGLLPRAQLVDELVRWEYAEVAHTDGYNDLLVDPAGTFEEVVSALRHGLIEPDVYAEVVDGLPED